MSKAIITILTLFIFVSCKQNNCEEKTKFTRLAVFYKDTSFVEMFIYPDTKHIDSTYLFRDKQIDSITLSLFTEKISYGLHWIEGFYGIYSFKLDKQYTGLLTRTPGEYESSAVSLWIYDIKNDSIVNNVQLSNIYVDAGDTKTTNSYLFFDKGRELKVLTYIHYIHDHSLDDVEFPESKISESYSCFLTRINATKLDTLSTDLIMLKKKYGQQLKRMAKY